MKTKTIQQAAASTGCVALLGAVAAFAVADDACAQTPIKVFILAGQSNMEGKGQVAGVSTPGTLEYMVDTDPANFGHLVTSGTSNWITRSDVLIASTTGPGNSLIDGGLSVGFGSSSNQIGPELGFGTVIGDAYGEDVLIIKTAWGGKSLKTDFRPPSAVLKRGGEVGFYYNEILSTVDNVLGNIGSYVPGYAGQGYELQGFGWHQGWNDRVDQAATDEYEQNMVDFINDIRFDLRAADLPFVIANTGIGGDAQYGGTGLTGRALTLANAQLGPGNLTIDPSDPNQINVAADLQYPEFVGNVIGVNTVSSWRLASDSPVPSGNQGFHWNQSGESYYLFGEDMGEAMAAMSGYQQYEEAYLSVNQQTGEIKLVNPGSNISTFELQGYSISSPSGALDPAEWASIDANYDASGDGSVDSGEWTITGSTNFGLGETADAGGDDGSLPIGNDLSLGNAWIGALDKDITATYIDSNGIVSNLYVLYEGFDNILADLNTDGTIDAADWSIFISNAHTDLSGLTGPEAYRAGDLDGDMDNDIRDYLLFKNAYEANNPAMSFAEMIATVPEPSSLLLMGAAGLLINLRRSPLR